MRAILLLPGSVRRRRARMLSDIRASNRFSRALGVVSALVATMACAPQDDPGGKAERDPSCAQFESLDSVAPRCSAATLCSRGAEVDVRCGGPCCGGGGSCCNGVQARIVDFEAAACFFEALAVSEPGELTLLIESSSKTSTEIVEILGDGTADVFRSVSELGAAASADVARVRVKPGEYVEACSNHARNEDTCLVYDCLREWFEPSSCTDDACCISEVNAGAPVLCL